MTNEYTQATDLDYAWLNFELDLPLEPMPDGSPNPFYVNRPGNPTSRLERELTRPYRQPPRQFFSGPRGRGKSNILFFGLVSRTPRALADSPIRLGEPPATSVNRLIRLSGGETISTPRRAGRDLGHRYHPVPVAPPSTPDAGPHFRPSSHDITTLTAGHSMGYTDDWIQGP